MHPTRLALAAGLIFGLSLPAFATGPAPAPHKPRNIVIFVADGLRYDSVTPDLAPTMWRIRKQGVDFTNSHSIYPTVTTANASAIATGHYLGDTGEYGNTLFVDFPVPCRLGAVVTFLEDDCIIRDVKEHYADGWMGQTTLVNAARAAGYNTAIFGKKGPAAMQDIVSLDFEGRAVDDPKGLFIDDGTNHPTNPDGTPTRSTILKGSLGADVFPFTGEAAPALTTAPNVVQQAWLQSMATQSVIPSLATSGKPFVLFYWSRDPDATQHSAVDSEGHLVPGINGGNAHAAISNADNNLKALIDALAANGELANTDIFVTADHGFSTIAKGIPSAAGDTPVASLPQGFLAIDVARWLGARLFDSDRSNTEVILEDGDRPSGGSALVGPSPDKPAAIIAANGGSDFIYAPGGRDVAKAIFAKLVAAPYVGALFVNDALLKDNPQDFAGALPMSKVRLIGAARMPQPAIVVGFRSFVANGCKLGALLCAAELADTGLHTGQGMHGSFSRADTRNFMAAIGPDFKKAFADPAPVSNADIAHTMAHIIGVTLSGPGTLTGRAATEALVGGKPVPFTARTEASAPGPGGVRTVLEYQEADGVPYFDAAGIPGRTVGLKAK
jgi:arylsulfatase A-like enzyme